MANRKKQKQILTLLLGGILLGSAAGCGEPKGQEPSGDAAGNAAEETPDGRWLDYEKYKDRLLENRISIPEYRNHYGTEAEQVRNTEYKNLSFSSAKFVDFPECEEVSLLRQEEIVMTPQESWDMIEQWLEDVGKRDLVDMEKEVRIATPELEWDDTKEFPYFYPALAEHMDLKNAAGAFFSTEDCKYRVCFSMSMGKIKNYLGKNQELADKDLNGEYTSDVVESGTLEELGDQSYPLISGELTIQEGADLLLDYFEHGTVTEPADGVSLEVAKVNVFRLKDVYGYEYVVHRVYKGVPAPRVGKTGFQLVGCPYLPIESDKYVYIVDDTGVSAYQGTSECTPYTELYTDCNILGVEDAARLLSEKLAVGLRMEVDEVSLVYAGYAAEIENTETMLLPCWRFVGMNHTKGEKLVAYVDVLTGDIYYYTIPPGDIIE